MHRFFVDSNSIKDNKVIIKDLEQVRQIVKVLRMNEGDEIIVLTDSDFEFVVQLSSLSKEEVLGRVKSKKKNMGELENELFLYQSLPKNMAKFELVLQKGTELGVSTFIPLITARTENCFLKKKDRLLKIIKEAAEQSGRGKLPILEDEVKIKDLFETKLDGEVILFDGRGESWKDNMVDFNKKGKINLFIGPEGGFLKEEIEMAKNKGWTVIALGSRILRTETAGIVASTLFGIGR